MLSVASAVVNAKGQRDIGRVLRRADADFLGKILAGQKVEQRQRLQKQWFLARYTPLYDRAHKLIGMLRVAVPHTGLRALRQAIMDIKVGKSGYVFVVGGSGVWRGHYLISAAGKRDGDNIWMAKDSTGRLFVQDIVKTAKAQ